MNNKTYLFMQAGVAAFAAMGIAARAKAGTITGGDLVVVQMGDGTATLTSAATTEFLNEYTTAGGAAVQQIALSAAGANPFTNSGSATSEGFVTQSTTGGYLTLGGYDAAVGALTVASTLAMSTPREIGYINLSNGSFDDTTTLNNAFDKNNIRSAVSVDGTYAYAGGAAAGPVYATKGATTGTSVTTNTNQRVVNYYGGNLYFSTGSGTHGIYQISGTPTASGATATNFIATGSSSSPYDFAFASSTVCYIADDSTVNANAGGGVQKWAYVSGTWTREYTLAPDGTVGERGLALSVNGDVVNIYATTAEASADKLVSMTDSLSATSIPTSLNYATLETAATNTIFRGVEFINPVPEPSSLALAAFGTTGPLTRRRRARKA